MLLLLLSLVGVATAQDWGSDNVVFVGDDTWAEYREKNPKFLAVFFAPWCGHCKALKQPYGEAAAELQFRVPLVAVDCTEEGKSTCNEFDVKGFPTIKWFGSSDSEGEDYDGGRDQKGFVDFVTAKVGDEPENFDGVDFKTFRVKQLKRLLFERGQDCKGCTEKKHFVTKVEETIHLPKSGPPPKKGKKKLKGSSLVNGRTVAQERRWKEAKKVQEEGWEVQGDVTHLIEDDFKQHRELVAKAGQGLLVMFYAPWCGHCKQAKPEYAAASTTLKEEGVSLAAVDCVTNAELCRAQKATAYPTYKYFTDAEDKGEVARPGQSEKSMVDYCRKQKNLDYEPIVEPFVNEALWEEDNGAVVHMTGEHWKGYMAENPRALVMFYAPWCGHCKAIKPTWAAASTRLQDKLPMLAVDCTVHSGLCGEFDVKGYPTLKYFSGDQEPEEVSVREEDALVAYGDRPETKTEL